MQGLRQRRRGAGGGSAAGRAPACLPAPAVRRAQQAQRAQYKRSISKAGTARRDAPFRYSGCCVKARAPLCANDRRCASTVLRLSRMRRSRSWQVGVEAIVVVC